MSRLVITPPAIEEPSLMLELDGLYLFAARQHVRRVNPAKTKIRRLTKRLIRLNWDLEAYTQRDDDDENVDSYVDHYQEILETGRCLEDTYYELVRAFRPSWQHCAEAIVLSSLAVEAHMNRRIIELVTPESAQDKLKWKSPPSAKMQEILRRLGKKEFGSTNRTLRDYQKIVQYRNNLAHYKPKLTFYDDSRLPKLPKDLGLIPREAKKAVRVAEDLIESFSKRLGVSPPSWIRKDIDHFFDFRVHDAGHCGPTNTVAH